MQHSSHSLVLRNPTVRLSPDAGGGLGPDVGEMSRSEQLTEQFTGGQLNAALAKAVVTIHNQYVGRGPSKGQAFFRNNTVVVLMEETLTKAEHSLVEAGNRALVLNMRREFQRTMERDLIDAVEDLTGCRVVAFMSDNHIDPDMATEIFVLDRPVPGEPADPSGWITRASRTPS